MLLKALGVGAMSLSLLGVSSMQIFPAEQEEQMMKTFHDFTVETLDGGSFDLSDLKGKKVLVVNTASECGFTPQYAQLQELYAELGGDTFEIIGFPANNFGAQEPGTNDEIGAFCQKNYGVTFPMMAKISVKGDDQHELYAWMTRKEQNGVGDYEVVWNFHKFLIDENGNLVRDVHPQTAPIAEEIIDWINQK